MVQGGRRRTFCFIILEVGKTINFKEINMQQRKSRLQSFPSHPSIALSHRFSFIVQWNVGNAITGFNCLRPVLWFFMINYIHKMHIVLFLGTIIFRNFIRSCCLPGYVVNMRCGIIKVFLVSPLNREEEDGPMMITIIKDGFIVCLSE